jgi:hypothetical protein
MKRRLKFFIYVAFRFCGELEYCKSPERPMKQGKYFVLFSAAVSEVKETFQNLKTLNWAGGMAQVVECLPSNHEALSSNPDTTKSKKPLNLG